MTAQFCTTLVCGGLLPIQPLVCLRSQSFEANQFAIATIRFELRLVGAIEQSSALKAELHATIPFLVTPKQAVIRSNEASDRGGLVQFNLRDETG